MMENSISINKSETKNNNLENLQDRPLFASKIARIIFLIIFIALAIFLPTYLGIIGLLFSSVKIAIVVFSAEAILITLIIILILSLKANKQQNDISLKEISSGFYSLKLNTNSFFEKSQNIEYNDQGIEMENTSDQKRN